MEIQNYVLNYALSSVDVASSINIEGAYYNGDTNNGVGSYLILQPGITEIDGIKLDQGTQVLLAFQTNSNENGIYFCNNVSPILLQRRPDFYSFEQMRAGQYLSVGNGTNAGMYIICDPLPENVGIDPLIIKPLIASIDSLNLNKLISENVIEPDEQNTIKSTFTNTLPINDPADPNTVNSVYGILSLNGLSTTNGVFSGVRGDFQCNSGTYSGPLTYTASALYGTLNLQNANINGALMAGCHVQIGAEGGVVATNVANVSAYNAYNITSITMGSALHVRGRYEYLFKSEFHFGSYLLNAGSAPGSAGDPTKCNAQKVVKFRDVQNNQDLFLAAFTSNA